MSDLYDRASACADVVRRRMGKAPETGVVLGSGLGAFAERLSERVAIPYGELPGFPRSSVQGHAGELVLGTVKGVRLAVMSGRVHYYEGHDIEAVTFPMRVLGRLGIRRVVITNAAGSVNPEFEPGDFMIIRDHINLTGQNPLRGHNDERLGPRFPDMSRAYGEAGEKALVAAAEGLGQKLRRGVYCGLSGPSYETPAEIRMLHTLGADAVGMSTVAEVIAARHMGIEVAGLSVITNRAAGLSTTPLSHDEVKEVGKRVGGALVELLTETAARFR